MATSKDKKGTRGKTGGRKAGTPNKTTKALKDAIMNAFDEAGGEKYLIKIAKKNPAIFCSLLAKILPSELSGKLDLTNIVISVDDQDSGL